MGTDVQQSLANVSRCFLESRTLERCRRQGHRTGEPTNMQTSVRTVCCSSFEGGVTIESSSQHIGYFVHVLAQSGTGLADHHEGSWKVATTWSGCMQTICYPNHRQAVSSWGLIAASDSFNQPQVSTAEQQSGSGEGLLTFLTL